MLGISYGELFLILGATAALIGPKDLPIIARTAGRLAGRAIGYVQLARGQFESVMQQTQARQVHKELQDTISQLEAIRHEIRSISFLNPSPLTTRLVDNIGQAATNSIDQTPASSTDLASDGEVKNEPERPRKEGNAAAMTLKDHSSRTSVSCDMHSQATTYARLAEVASANSEVANSDVLDELTDESGIIILPVSAENAGLLPARKGEANGSDIVLEAILEAEVARNAKEFFSQPQNQIKCE